MSIRRHEHSKGQVLHSLSLLSSLLLDMETWAIGGAGGAQEGRRSELVRHLTAPPGEAD